MPAKHVVLTQQIAGAINKVKIVHIWDAVIPISLLGVVNQMWSVCAIICNAQLNIISVCEDPVNEEANTDSNSLAD
jgi:hypothetical protein